MGNAKLNSKELGVKGNEFISVIDFESSEWRDLCYLKQIATFNSKTGELIIRDQGEYDELVENDWECINTLTEKENQK
jgi:hypothetical protein